MLAPTIHAGTSGYSYKEWKGSFYPEKLAAKKFLEFYATRLTTVEINNTYYRFPAEKLMHGWRDTVPDGFTFAVKAHAGITHRGRLKEVDEFASDFVHRCRELGPKLGPILFQLPPFFKKDAEVLAAFVEKLPDGSRYAFEFRHETWFEDDVMDILRNRGVSLCISEGDKLETPRTATAPFVYLRLRKDEYSSEELDEWRVWMDGQLAEGRDVFVYLKHDDEGVSPEHALRLLGGVVE